jgi:hypothetical protein
MTRSVSLAFFVLSVLFLSSTGPAAARAREETHAADAPVSLADLARAKRR